LKNQRASDQLYKDAWSKFASGVTVITTMETSGSVHGMTASSVTSVSLDPPLVLVVVGEERQSHELIENNGRFGISILRNDQVDIAIHFATPPEERDSISESNITSLGQSQVISGAIASMDCLVTDAYKAGDHTIFLGNVCAIQLGKGDPLVWFQREFGGFNSS